jgi:methionyl-tRNA formyltransferase
MSSHKNIVIGYFADGPWSHQALERILSDESIKVKFVCARFDNPDPILKRMAEVNELPFYAIQNINSDEFIKEVLDYKCDLLVSMSFNQIFKKKILDIPSLGVINCHAGKLPFYRGRNILNWVLINDEKEFGITVHFVDEGIDTGDIICQSLHPIKDDDDYASLLARAYEGCSELLYSALKKFQLEKDIERISQNKIHPLGFYCTARMKGDEVIDWKQSSRDIFNFVRALTLPGPGARSTLESEPIIIYKARELISAVKFKGVPGAIIGINNEGFLVKTSDSFLEVTNWKSARSPRVGDRLK